MVACGSLAGFIPGVQAADVRILPVDNAKFLAGAKFDFDIEVSKAKNLKNVDITVNGQKADKFFGQKLGVMDNTEVFFGIMRALGIDATKNVK